VTVLLDTNAIVFLGAGLPVRAEARRAVDAALQADGVLVSPVSAWEIGLAAARGRLQLNQPVIAWFQQFLRAPGVRLTPLTVTAALEASALPEPLHRDPGDRLLVATARELGTPLVTRDQRLIRYGKAGHLQGRPAGRPHE
jgi:PIN domain nuclease of toxin-antitoxin system